MTTTREGVAHRLHDAIIGAGCLLGVITTLNENECDTNGEDEIGCFVLIFGDADLVVAVSKQG